ncbi:MAG: hypothetical protein ABI680_18000 [Chthoniobacteraceae bacterium]
MPDWPTETITDQDPRYRELLEQEAEARLRFLASDQARAEMDEAAAHQRPRSSWKVAHPLPIAGPHAPAIPWTRSR